MMARRWFSRKYYNSPMPHSIFFHGGYAIHGSYEIRRLGGPASHGCVRLHPVHAAALFALVQKYGSGNTRIVISNGTRMAYASR
jgi:lipoprotein-anchoring transpeptidase ErfK/SrfK